MKGGGKREEDVDLFVSVVVNLYACVFVGPPARHPRLVEMAAARVMLVCFCVVVVVVGGGGGWGSIQPQAK